MVPASVLFARPDSVYRGLSFDVWDESRDARGYAGPWPVVAHPPCRTWGRLRHRTVGSQSEKSLALFAVDAVRRWGGVLEHPFGSALWAAAGLPSAASRAVDSFGGFTLLCDQGWFGHPAPKPTLLYVCGRSRESVTLPAPSVRRATGRTLDLTVADRERTPEAFAVWLVALAAGCRAAVTSTRPNCYLDQAALLLRPGAEVTAARVAA